LAKTIAYQSSLDWFSSRKTRGKYSSPREALREHIRYITRPSECALSWNLKLDDWLRRADVYLSQRRDARIAGKRIFALPNNLSPGEGLALLKEFLTTRELFSIRKDGRRIKARLDENDFGIAIHDSKGISGERNLHAHIVFSSKTRVEGKEYSLNLTKVELKNLYREWESFLQERGYTLRRSPVREPHSIMGLPGCVTIPGRGFLTGISREQSSIGERRLSVSGWRGCWSELPGCREVIFRRGRRYWRKMRRLLHGGRGSFRGGRPRSWFGSLLFSRGRPRNLSGNSSPVRRSLCLIPILAGSLVLVSNSHQ